MRFQPSWVIESLHPHSVDSVFFPISPRAEALLWLKKQGIQIYANDPLHSNAILLKAYLENQGETFSEENQQKFNRVIKEPLDVSMNPFREWLGKPFDRRQIDYLFYWREAAVEIAEQVQRNLFYSAIRSVISYWLDMVIAKIPIAFAPDEILGHAIKKQLQQIFPGKEKVFALNVPMEELGDEVEASVFLLPLKIQERYFREFECEDYFHAWIVGNSNLEASRRDIENSRRSWVFDWKYPLEATKIFQKVGKANHAVICWSGEELPPRLHEEQIVEPFRKAFSGKFQKNFLYMKTSDLSRDDYDFLLVFQK